MRLRSVSLAGVGRYVVVIYKIRLATTPVNKAFSCSVILNQRTRTSCKPRTIMHLIHMSFSNKVV